VRCIKTLNLSGSTVLLLGCLSKEQASVCENKENENEKGQKEKENISLICQFIASMII